MLIITIDDLLKKITDLDNLDKIKKAYIFAENKLKNQKRLSGDTKISHVLEVASILCDLNVDSTTIIASLLFEAVDEDYDKQEIINVFGEDVYTIVSSIKKINRLEMVDDSENSAIYLRKVMVGLSEDVRVLFLKLADRLHNMQTMESLDKEYQKKVANETLSVLIPIAHRLGINSIKSELENLCLYYLKPDVYNDILDRLNDTVDELNEHLLEMKENISKLIKDAGIKFEIKGRVKSVYSIYNKLSKGRKWEDIYDILALRIFVEKESDCYAVVGIIHSHFKPVQNRFKDFIAVPKENMYQSLHTTVFGEGGRFYEIQIRTYEMDEIAEKGIASHWSYKEKGTKKIQTMMEQKLELYRSIIEQAEVTEDNEFINTIDNDILSDLIYVFTPKGDVIELPAGSTPIDFAYRIHSKVGDTMIGAIVNDQMVPITSELHENDIVKIMTNPNSKPNKDWLNVVKSNQAKNKIKAFFSKIDKDEYIEKGKSMLEKEAHKRKISYNGLFTNDNINKICKELKLKDFDDICLSIGSFRYTAGYILNILNEDEKTGEIPVIRKADIAKNNRNSDILVDNKESILTHLAKCCNPIKGDNIIGVITRNVGIAIHRDSCPNASSNNKKVSVSWSVGSSNTYPANIIITLADDNNRLSDIIASITSLNIKILKIDVKSDLLYSVEVYVSDTDELDTLIKNIRKLRYIKDVVRV